MLVICSIDCILVVLGKEFLVVGSGDFDGVAQPGRDQSFAESLTEKIVFATGAQILIGPRPLLDD